jgi:hypothetical protein
MLSNAAFVMIATISIVLARAADRISDAIIHASHRKRTTSIERMGRRE